MPLYTFKNEVTGKRKEFYLTYEKYNSVMIVDGVKWERDLESDLPKARVQSEAFIGQESHALAINPSQIKGEKEYAKKRGVDIDFNPKNGRPKFRDRKNRKDYCQLRGVVDYEGGFGDST